MKNLVVLALALVVILGFNVSVKAQSKIDEIVDTARKQTYLLNEVRELQNTTRTICVRPSGEDEESSLQKCKDVLEILSMDIELIGVLRMVNIRGVDIIISSYEQNITLRRGDIIVPIRASIPQIREFFGLQAFFPTDYLDREFMVERLKLP